MHDAKSCHRGPQQQQHHNRAMRVRSAAPSSATHAIVAMSAPLTGSPVANASSTAKQSASVSCLYSALVNAVAAPTNDATTFCHHVLSSGSVITFCHQVVSARYKCGFVRMKKQNVRARPAINMFNTARTIERVEASIIRTRHAHHLVQCM